MQGGNGFVLDEAHHARRHLAYPGDDEVAQGPSLRERRTWMPDIALGTAAQRRAKAESVTARLRATRGWSK